MRKFIVASHSKQAYGLVETLKYLTGKVDCIYEISAYIDDVSIDEQIETCFRNIHKDDEVIILTDMMGGSVNQKFYPCMSEHVHLICGVNLPLALSLMLQAEDNLTTKQIEGIIEEAKSQIIYMNEYTFEENNEDE